MKEKILLILGPEDNKTNNESVVELFQECLSDYNITAPGINYNDCDSVMPQITAQSLSHTDYIIGVGLGCLFVHQMVGFDRICINPIMSILETEEYQSHLSEEEIDRYLAMERTQYAYDRSLDFKNDTHCWGIYRNDEILMHRYFSMLYYPQIVTRPCTTINEDLINNVVASLLETIDKSCWIDECGVHFKNYGRTISGVDPAIFNNVDSYEIPDGVTTICPEAFAQSNLQSVYIPSSVRTLGNSCFHACKNLREVIFADDSHVGIIPEYCFAETAISFMELPNSVFSIQTGAMAESYNLKEVAICGELQYIGRDAFKGCGQVYIKMKAHKIADMLDGLQQQRDADYEAFCRNNPIESDELCL